MKEKLTTGFQASGKTFKVHLDGYNQMDLLSGKGPGVRKEFFYFSDDGDLTGLRYNRWKVVFLEQRAHGLEVWRDPLVAQRVPKIFDVRADPFERADIESGAYERWFIDRAFLLVPAQAVVAQFLATFREFPPRQKPASFSVDQALEAMQKASAGRD